MNDANQNRKARSQNKRLPTQKADGTLNFIFQDDYDIRVVARKGQPWFVAWDVCDALDMDRAALQTLVADEVASHKLDTISGWKDAPIINLSGLCAFIFASNGRHAEAFKRWIPKKSCPMSA